VVVVGMGRDTCGARGGGGGNGSTLIQQPEQTRAWKMC